MKKLLIIVTDARFFLSHRLPLAIAAKREGWDVAVLGPNTPYGDKVIQHGIHYEACGVGRGKTGMVTELLSLVRMGKFMARYRPTVIHLVALKASIYGGLIGRLLQIPAVISISGLGYFFTADSFVRRNCRKAILFALRISTGNPRNHFIYQNLADLECLRNARIGQCASYSIVAGSGVDLEKIRPSKLAEGQRVIVLPARMLRDKGVCEFIAAARMLRMAGCTARFILVGDTDPANPSSLQANELSQWVAEGHVSWRGYDPEIGDVLKESHIVVLPSYREGFPKTLIDAAAAGRVCVTCDVAGCRDAIVQGVTGYLVPPRDIERLAEVLSELIASPATQEKMGLAARAHAERHFDVRDVCAKHLEIYEKLSSLDGVEKRTGGTEINASKDLSKVAA